MNDCQNVIMQGDQYFIQFEIEADGETLTPQMISVIEFTVGTVTKEFNAFAPSPVAWSPALQAYLFPITQEETFLFKGKQRIQFRVKDRDDNVYGHVVGDVSILYSNSKEVL